MEAHLQSGSQPIAKTEVDRTLPRITKRDGRVVNFDEARIFKAIEKAFQATQGLSADDQLPDTLIQTITHITREVVLWCSDRQALGVEQIQDEVERALMRHGHHLVARRYILYREARQQARIRAATHYCDESGVNILIPKEEIRALFAWAANGLDQVDENILFEQAEQVFYENIDEKEVRSALILSARVFIERDPQYDKATARLLLADLYRVASSNAGLLVDIGLASNPEELYKGAFESYLESGIESGRIDPRLRDYDISQLKNALQPQRDEQFTYLGLQTLQDRYLIHDEAFGVELPQWLWMRVAMGLALNEEDATTQAIAFYELLSSFRFMSSTPTLFNSGTPYPQLSSCYLTTVDDDLGAIFKAIRDNALLSKWAGGLGNDWTNVRAMGAYIKSTSGQSQGVVPFLKVANDTAVAVNQGGKRKGAVCAYLETWHLDIEEFLELRRNTGDERRRTHDMNTANWVPDLFMQRVHENKHWTLFSPDEVSDLHDLYGSRFKQRYEQYERLADQGAIKNWKRLDAQTLWRKMLSMLFETGHPWITFKDPCNIRSPQDHKGVVHSSNLCTEITLNTSPNETAVCNLGSINLTQHLSRSNDGRVALDLPRLKATVRTAIRMLDNVIDINYYPTPEARAANLEHRPIGLGMMGFQDTLYELAIPYASEEAVQFADFSMEAVSLYAIEASTDLAGEKGVYTSYNGSKWDRGIFPIDSLTLLEKERGQELPLDKSSRFEIEWGSVRDKVARYGMRNSNVMAIAPTATIANITGTSQSIEPTYKHLYAKSNLSGEFTQVNRYLVEELKAIGMWDKQMVDDLKYFDGSIAEIDRIPRSLRDRFLSAFEIDAKWLVECAARRQKWIDQAQSLNLYMATTSGRALSELYHLAWQKGLKTTYYLRSLAATQVEKSTLNINQHGIQPRWMQHTSASSRIATGQQCSIDDPECEACQ